MILDEIRQGFANLNLRAVAQLRQLPVAFPGWIYRANDGFGVAIEVPRSTEVSEYFSGAELFTRVDDFGNGPVLLLHLECARVSLRNEFAVVCAQFVDPGLGGDLRRELTENPHAWWKRWRQLLGNAIREKSAHAVLGELLAFERLLEMGCKPVWLGPNSGSHDFETETESYEIKATIAKYQSEIHVTGQFQLMPSPPKPLFLVHQRFEPCNTGESVDTLVKRLVARGVHLDELDGQLDQIGFPRGSSARAETFTHLESRKFLVDSSFPRIVPGSFAGGALPQGIVGLEYRVDLSALSSTAF